MPAATPRVDVVSIGTLARNLLWNEPPGATRTAHATTVLVRAGKRAILVNPGLPGVAIAARLHERTGLRPDAVTDVFFTHLRADSALGRDAFPNAALWCGPRGAEDRGADVDERAFGRGFDPRVAPDKLAPGVDLFPLPGHTPGTCGLLVSSALSATLICGPAVATRDHFLAQQVLPDAADVAAAKEALVEAAEIADVIVPGYDNVFVNPSTLRGGGA